MQRWHMCLVGHICVYFRLSPSVREPRLDSLSQLHSTVHTILQLLYLELGLPKLLSFYLLVISEIILNYSTFFYYNRSANDGLFNEFSYTYVVVRGRGLLDLLVNIMALHFWGKIVDCSVLYLASVYVYSTTVAQI